MKKYCENYRTIFLISHVNKFHLKMMDRVTLKIKKIKGCRESRAMKTLDQSVDRD